MSDLFSDLDLFLNESGDASTSFDSIFHAIPTGSSSVITDAAGSADGGHVANNASSIDDTGHRDSRPGDNVPTLESKLLSNILSMSEHNDMIDAASKTLNSNIHDSPSMSATSSVPGAGRSPNQVVPLTQNTSPPTFMLGNAADVTPSTFSLAMPATQDSPTASSRPTTPLTPVTALANQLPGGLALNTPTSAPRTPRARVLDPAGGGSMSPYIGPGEARASSFLHSDGSGSPFFGSDPGCVASIPDLSLDPAHAHDLAMPGRGPGITTNNDDTSALMTQLNQSAAAATGGAALSNTQLYTFLTQHFHTLLSNNPSLLSECQKLLPASQQQSLVTRVAAAGRASHAKESHKKHRQKQAKGYQRRERPVRPKVIESKGSVQCAGLNRKKNTQCRNAALMEYIGPRPIYCAEHIENDPNSKYMKCSANYQKQKGDGKSCKEVVLKEFAFCYKHFHEVLIKLDGMEGAQQAAAKLKRVQEVLAMLESEAQAAKKTNTDLYQRKNKLIPKFQTMKSLLILKMQELPPLPQQQQRQQGTGAASPTSSAVA